MLCMLLLGGCSGQSDTPPANILKPQAMVRLMIDLHLSESKAMQVRVPGDTVRYVYTAFKERALKKNNTDSATFNRSFKWYSSHTDLMDKVYADVVDSLGVRETKGDWY